jgi:hypothetical protein
VNAQPLTAAELLAYIAELVDPPTSAAARPLARQEVKSSA